jgi:hypothetical protein
LNNPAQGRIVVIMKRLHENDLAGELLNPSRGPDTEQLNIAERKSDPRHGIRNVHSRVAGSRRPAGLDAVKQGPLCSITERRTGGRRPTGWTRGLWGCHELFLQDAKRVDYSMFTAALQVRAPWDVPGWGW